MARQKPDYVYEEKFTITEFLSSHSKKRNIDNAFILWCRKKDNTNPQKTVENWNKLLNEFLNEV